MVDIDSLGTVLVLGNVGDAEVLSIGRTSMFAIIDELLAKSTSAE